MMEHVECQRCHVNESFICISFSSGDAYKDDRVFQITGIINDLKYIARWEQIV